LIFLSFPKGKIKGPGKTMLNNHLKMTWRRLLRERQFTILNLVGLSTGLTCAILIGLWVHDELRIDHDNVKDKQLFQVLQNGHNQQGIETVEPTPGLLASALREEVPEIEYSTSVIPATWFSNKGLISVDDTHIRVSGQFVGKEYFEIFTCPFIEGAQNQLFSDKYRIAISDALAIKLFHTSSHIIGKTITWNQDNFNGQYQIVGVFKSLRAHRTAQFDMLLNYDLFLEKNPKLENWDNSDPSTYVIVKAGADIDRLGQKISRFVKTKNEKSDVSLLLQKYADRYLYNHYENGAPSGGRIEYLRLFTIIALFILVVACINFMNLSTARASRRLKEVGVKKVMGASRATLIRQYLGESLFMAFLSLLISITMVLCVLPAFNSITGKELRLQFDSSLILGIFVITTFTGLVAGSYPALYLSGFKAAAVLKGKLRSSVGELSARKGLVIFQFVLSAVLIVSVLVVYKQMQYIRSTDLGYNRDHIIFFDKGGIESETKEDYKPGGLFEKNLISFIDQIKQIPGVIDATNFRHSITNRHGGTTDVQWEGKQPGDLTSFTDLAAGYDFIETLGIQMAAGRSFSREFGAEKSKIIFNQAAINAMGLKNPIGKIVHVWGEDKQIIGVAKDFHFESFYENLKPCFFDFSYNRHVSRIMVKINAGTEKSTIGRIAEFYHDFSGEHLQYQFLDADYQALYTSEERVSLIARYFAGLAILISCLGLFGLAAFTAQKRQKEIGIRKVVGASGLQVGLMLSKEFLKPVMISMLIAFPISWWAMSAWLHVFAYRITMGLTIFIIAGALILLITMLTVGFQSIKAALTNPVGSLRNE
jgi:putative ABC transport system permease protein